MKTENMADQTDRAYGEWIHSLRNKLNYTDRMAKELESAVDKIATDLLKQGIPVQELYTVRAKLVRLQKRLRKA